MSRIWLCAIAMFSAFSCDRADAPDCLKSAGDLAVETRSLNGQVSTLELDDLVHLTVFNHDGGNDYLVVKGPANLLPGVETALEGSTLRIQNTNRCNWVRDLGIRLELELHTSALQHVLYTGQGDVVFADTLVRSSFSLENRNGTGDLHLRVHADSLSVVVHTGYSNVLLEGSCTSANYFNQGWGVFNAARMSGFAVSCNNSSINEMYVNSVDYLYAFIGSRGNVHFYGNPNRIESGREGSGMLIAAED